MTTDKTDNTITDKMMLLNELYHNYIELVRKFKPKSVEQLKIFCSRAENASSNGMKICVLY